MMEGTAHISLSQSYRYFLILCLALYALSTPLYYWLKYTCENVINPTGYGISLIMFVIMLLDFYSVSILQKNRLLTRNTYTSMFALIIALIFCIVLSISGFLGVVGDIFSGCTFMFLGFCQMISISILGCAMYIARRLQSNKENARLV